MKKLTLSRAAVLRAFHTNSTTADITAKMSPVTSTTNIPPTFASPGEPKNYNKFLHQEYLPQIFFDYTHSSAAKFETYYSLPETACGRTQ